jgi:hypothetical protein
MNGFYTSKHFLKKIRWRLRRAKAGLKYGWKTLDHTPRVFGNAMPKSGSHLLTQILGGLTSLGPLVNPGFPPVNRSEDNQPLSQGNIIKNIQQMKSGDIRYGYVHAEEPYLSMLTESNRATIFLYRDPRDMLVSHVFYATEMHKGHGMHPYYTEVLSTMEERLNAAIQGVTEPGFELASVKQRYDYFLGWLTQPDVLGIRFEDLILDRDLTLGTLLDYLGTRGFNSYIPREEAIEILKNAIVPRKSGTFRKGVPGNWREIFTDSNKALFNHVAGDLLVQLGYEQDQSW